MTYEDPYEPTYENCSFTFVGHGKFYSIPLDKFNELYDISDQPKDVSVTKKFSPQKAFWELIATREFKPRTAYQSLIRNVTLRIVSKVLANLLFAKDKTSKVTNGELQVLYTGIEDEIRRARPGIPICR